MSDLEVLKRMLDTASILYTESKDEDIAYYRTNLPTATHGLDLGNGPTLPGKEPGSYTSTPVGYASCSSLWLFDADGKLLAVGHHEG